MVTWTLEADLHSSVSLLRLLSLDSFGEPGQDLPLAMLTTPRYMFTTMQDVNWPIRELSKGNIVVATGFLIQQPQLQKLYGWLLPWLLYSFKAWGPFEDHLLSWERWPSGSGSLFRYRVEEIQFSLVCLNREFCLKSGEYDQNGQFSLVEKATG